MKQRKQFNDEHEIQVGEVIRIKKSEVYLVSLNN